MIQEVIKKILSISDPQSMAAPAEALFGKDV